MISKEVVKVLQMNIIEHLSSAWRNPIVLVPKPDGSRRFCIDFKGVNKIAAFDAYLMPHLDVILSQLGSTYYVMP